MDDREMNTSPDTESAAETEERPDLSYTVVGAAIEVHNAIGSGYDAATYRRAVAEELKERGLAAVFEQTAPIMFKGVQVGEQALDCVVEEELVLEFRAEERLSTEQKARAMMYLRGIQYELGVLLNFGGSRLEFVRVPHQRRRREGEDG